MSAMEWKFTSIQLFVQQLVQENINENIRAPHHRFSVMGNHWYPAVSCTRASNAGNLMSWQCVWLYTRAVTLRHSKDNTKHFEPNPDYVLPKYSINYIYIILDVTIQHMKAHHNDLCWTIEFGIQWDIMRWQITHHYDITSPPWVFKFTSSFIVCSTACQCKHGRKHQSSKSLILCGGKPRLPGGLSAHKASNTVSLFIPNI